MSCLNPCADSFNLGCFLSCDSIALPLTAEATGLHKISYKRRGMGIVRDFSMEIGVDIFVSGEWFNEIDKEVVFQILDHNGDVMTYNDSGTIYNSFCISFSPGVEIGVDEDEVDLCLTVVTEC